MCIYTSNILYPIWKYTYQGFPPPHPTQCPPRPLCGRPPHGVGWGGGKPSWVSSHIGYRILDTYLYVFLGHKSVHLVAVKPNSFNEKRHPFCKSVSFCQTLTILSNIRSVFCIFGMKYKALGTYVHAVHTVHTVRSVHAVHIVRTVYNCTYCIYCTHTVHVVHTTLFTYI